jgi:hypothetical protein
MQYDFGTIDPYVVDGVQLASMLNNWRDALHTMHRGAARPAYAQPGMMWINDTGGPTNWLVRVYLGPSIGDVTLWSYNTTTGAIGISGGPFLPLAGGTLTGALLGTTALFDTQLKVGTAPSEGFVQINEGGPANTGYVAFYNAAGVRQGYIGFTLPGVQYTSETGPHVFTGNVEVPTPATTDVSVKAATTAFVSGFHAAVFGTNAGQVNLGAINNQANVCNTGAIGAAGQKWLIEAGAGVANTPASYDFISLRLWNGSASVAQDLLQQTINGSPVFGSVRALVTLAAPTTFTLQAKNGSTANGYVAANQSWITAQRVS